MKIYFLRHGESVGNEGGLVQTRDYPLSEKGRKQAQAVTKTLSGLDLDEILCSSFPRARETAEIVNEHLGLPVEYFDCLGEILYPSCIRGLAYESKEAETTLRAVDENFHLPDYRHSDEETFFDFRSRGIEVLELLRSRKAENILVSTHGTFIKMLLGLILVGETLTPEQFQRMRRVWPSRNTGLSMVEYSPEKEGTVTRGWRLLSYDDASHLSAGLLSAHGCRCTPSTQKGEPVEKTT